MNRNQTTETQKRYRIEMGYTETTVRGPQVVQTVVRVWAENEKDARGQVLDFYRKSRPYVISVGQA